MKKGRKEKEVTDNARGGSVVEYLYGDQVDKEEVDKAPKTHGNYHSSVQQFFISNLKGRDLLGDLGLS